MAYMIWTASGKQTVATVEASAEPVKAYFKIKADAIPGTATVRKTTDSGDVEGYCFKIYRWDSNTSWYGKTDGDGNLYLTDSAYSQSGTKTYTFSNLLDGEYTFLEVLSQKGAGRVFRIPGTLPSQTRRKKPCMTGLSPLRILPRMITATAGWTGSPLRDSPAAVT